MTAAGPIIPQQQPESLKQVGRWQATLHLGFVYQHGKTLLKRRDGRGPLTVQRSLYPETPDVCHTYLIHPPGGMVGGDCLDLRVDVAAQAHAVITTPSAGKIYQSTGAESVQLQQFHLAKGASLEWMPQEMILYGGSKSRLKTRIDLEQSATFIGWELLCLGRLASDDVFSSGQCTQQLQLYRGGEPLLLDRFATTGNHTNRSSRWGMVGHSLFATFIAVGVSPSCMEAMQKEVQGFAHGQAGLTLIDDVLICRCLSDQARHVKKLFMQLWVRLRPLLLSKQVALPRIWLT